MLYRLCVLLLCGLGLGAGPAVGQNANLETVEGPGAGERTTLTPTPYSLADGLSVRVLGVSGRDTTRWGFRLIGAERDDDIRLRYGGEELPIVRIDRPAEGEIGPTTVYVGREAFLTMAETETVTLQVGDTRTSLPDDLRRQMRRIFEVVTG